MSFKGSLLYTVGSRINESRGWKIASASVKGIYYCFSQLPVIVAPGHLLQQSSTYFGLFGLVLIFFFF